MYKTKSVMTFDANVGDSGRSFIQVRETITTLEGPLKGEQNVKTGFKPWNAANLNTAIQDLRDGKLQAILGKRVPNQTLYTVTIIDPNATVEETVEEEAEAGELTTKE